MRDYAIVREELWSLRRLNNTIVMSVIAAVAVGIPALVALAGQADPTILPTALLGIALTLGFVTMVLIGIDSSFKVVEYLSQQQALALRSELKAFSGLPVSDATLGLQILAQRISQGGPHFVWLASFGAWAFVRLIVPAVALAALAAGALSAGPPSQWTVAMMALVVADLAIAAGAGVLWMLGLQVPRRLREFMLVAGEPGSNKSDSDTLKRRATTVDQLIARTSKKSAEDEIPPLGGRVVGRGHLIGDQISRGLNLIAFVVFVGGLISGWITVKFPTDTTCLIPKQETGIGNGPVTFPLTMPDACAAIVDAEYVAGIPYHGVFLAESRSAGDTELTITSGGIRYVRLDYAKDVFCEVLGIAVGRGNAIAYVRGFPAWGSDPCSLGREFPPATGKP